MGEVEVDATARAGAASERSTWGLGGPARWELIKEGLFWLISPTSNGQNLRASCTDNKRNARLVHRIHIFLKRDLDSHCDGVRDETIRTRTADEQMSSSGSKEA